VERDLLVQALIIVILANTLVVGLALVGGRAGRRRARASRSGRIAVVPTDGPGLTWPDGSAHAVTTAGTQAVPLDTPADPEAGPLRAVDEGPVPAADNGSSAPSGDGSVPLLDEGPTAVLDGGQAALEGSPTAVLDEGRAALEGSQPPALEPSHAVRPMAVATAPTVTAPTSSMARDGGAPMAAHPRPIPHPRGANDVVLVVAEANGGTSSTVPARVPPAVEPLDWEGLAELAELEGPTGWHRAVLRETHRHHRSAGKVAAVSLEVLGHRALEERFGRAAASAVSEPLAMTIRSVTRRADVIARVGPAAFRVLLLDGDDQAASRYVERVSRTVDPWLAAGALTLRLSAGAAAAPDEGGVEEAIRLSERRMYQGARRPDRLA
jgi:GGDEF domain-containing protein